MDLPQLTPGDNGRLSINGELCFDTVPALATRMAEVFHNKQPLIVDLQGVKRADSAGLALLIEWQREALRRQTMLSFENIPAQLLAIARVSGVASLLSLQ